MKATVNKGVPIQTTRKPDLPKNPNTEFTYFPSFKGKGHNPIMCCAIQFLYNHIWHIMWTKKDSGDHHVLVRKVQETVAVTWMGEHHFGPSHTRVLP